MKVLIVDDDEAVRLSLRAQIEKGDPWEVKDQGFDGLGEVLEEFRPDAVVLDLVEGDVTGEPAVGNRSFEQIHDRWFCPVVVYSGYGVRQKFKHPLAVAVSKRTGADLEVVRRLREFAPTAQVIRDVHRDFDDRIREALRDSVHVLRKQLGKTADGNDDAVLPRAVRRLVAARMDAAASGDGRIKAWERFVVPALGPHLLSADLLRRKEVAWTDPEAFRLILTPSCDLVPHGGSAPRAERILVARCESIRRLGEVEVNPGATLSKKQRDKLRPLLTEGIADGLLPIPQFIGHVPSMAANLKHLDLVGWDEVRLETEDGHAAADGAAFVRVASTDSPFRELVVWAYLRVTGRPGAPECDVDGWLDDISDATEGTGRP